MGKLCNVLRKIFKLVEKSHSIGVFKSIALWGWCHRQGGETHYEMRLLGFWGNSPETLSNAWEPRSQGSLPSDTWKWRAATGLQKNSWLLHIARFLVSKKGSGITIAMGTSKPPAGNILFQFLIAAHDLLLLAWAREAQWDTWGPRSPKLSICQWLHSLQYQGRCFAPWLSVTPVQ